MPLRRALSLRPIASFPVCHARIAFAALLIGGPVLGRLAASGTPASLLAAVGIRGEAGIAGNAPLTLAPPEGNWDFSRHESLHFTLRNPGRERATVWARAENPGAQGVTDNVRNALVLEPGARGELRLRLMRRPEDPGYAPFKPFFMYFKNLNPRSRVGSTRGCLAGGRRGRGEDRARDGDGAR
jgi:hypothetical protein